MTVVLYGCDTWSFTLRDERRLRVFEKREFYCMTGNFGYLIAKGGRGLGESNNGNRMNTNGGGSKCVCEILKKKQCILRNGYVTCLLCEGQTVKPGTHYRHVTLAHVT